MGSLSLLSLTTISQYALFTGIALVLFGWFEKKERLAYAGQGVFVLSAVFALWLIGTNTIQVQSVSGNEISKEIKIMSFLKLLIGLGAVNIISILLGLLKNKYYKSSLFVIILAALSLFFMIFNLLQTPVSQ